MCCLFGLIDYQKTLSVKQKNRITSALAAAAEERGTDATGIAYVVNNHISIFKRPWRGKAMHFRIPADAHVIMGHTRLTTQGNAKKNYNNHPFPGTVNGSPFALAHNGMLFNDEILRHTQRLPKTKVETDSYIAVQLIEAQKALDFTALRHMAEKVEGSFTFTVLDTKDNLYVVKGDNPLCLYHYPASGLYLYASTENILRSAISKTKLRDNAAKKITIDCGEIVRIDRVGDITRSIFDDTQLLCRYDPFWGVQPYCSKQFALDNAETVQETSYLDELKSVAAAYGYSPESIDRLLGMGIDPEEIEEYIYSANPWDVQACAY